MAAKISYISKIKIAGTFDFATQILMHLYEQNPEEDQIAQRKPAKRLETNEDSAVCWLGN